jgi:hypothetical protein|nr:MAG TPA_asm: HIGH-POTENTIAL IRON-SULFUR PROTEIN FROM ECTOTHIORHODOSPIRA TRANSFER(IRON-SULFUR PROTEIN).8A [Caudoviricetes sp.]
MREVPKGERKCEECQFYHPERKDKPCSGFGKTQNKDGNCSLFIYCDRNERVEWR